MPVSTWLLLAVHLEVLTQAVVVPLVGIEPM